MSDAILVQQMAASNQNLTKVAYVYHLGGSQADYSTTISDYGTLVWAGLFLATSAYSSWRRTSTTSPNFTVTAGNGATIFRMTLSNKVLNINKNSNVSFQSFGCVEYKPSA